MRFVKTYQTYNEYYTYVNGRKWYFAKHKINQVYPLELHTSFHRNTTSLELEIDDLINDHAMAVRKFLRKDAQGFYEDDQALIKFQKWMSMKNELNKQRYY